MGTKRPFDEEFQQFIKHPKHLDYGNKLALFADSKLSNEASENTDLAEKELETSAPLSLVTSNGGEEDAGSGDLFYSSLFPEYFEFNFPRRRVVHFDDTYSSLLNCSPRKEVPLGSIHQADVPEFDSEVLKKHSISYGMNVVGVCVIPMPDLYFSAEDGEAADGRADCRCLDGGSVRCVQQHVKEARVKLRETLGHVNFVDLGFEEMGEEVALRWTEEEERIFNNVVYSNPVSLGKKFWEHLSMVFPSRTKQELVTYYFNVFMLQRRAAQNRSKLLEIDSDDDEWRGPRGYDREPFGVGGEDENFVVGSFIGHDVPVDHGDDSSSDDADVQVGGADATEKDGGEFEVKEDSCTCFEGQQYVPENCGPVDKRASAIQENTVKSEKGKCLPGNKDEVSNDGLGSQYALEQCDGKVWDAPYSMGPTKRVDLLSTCSMIEEIFGPSRNGNNIS